ncbi:DUF805 domain-containing protein [Roseovarius nubinhibens]|uniref:DUF805 domain-containing protein n=1 Tax=Roseovarius nubinhibens TaxID=314263 RepID=UPI001C0908FC|nr:DUF805 domain-containing protein [Roseovarius nubinhibens]MBU3000388.1 DUF805 domain-containing protein [Roseovarius nubinhibens]
MGFKEAIRTVLKEKYATFQGRASRSEFWYFTLFTVLMVVVFIGLALLTGGLDMVEGGGAEILPLIFFGLYGLFGLAILIPTIAVTVRRLHDRNMSGWWYLGFVVGGMIPFVGPLISIAMFVILALKGTAGDNKFGPDPLRGAANSDVFA